MKLDFDRWLQTVPERPQPSETSICTSGKDWNTIIVTRGRSDVQASQTVWGFRLAP